MYFNTNGTTYWIEKSGSGPALLLLHGFTSSAATWQTFVEKWQKTHTVLAIDLPGHGRTTTSVPKTMEACCRDIAAILQSLEINKVHLLGYSMGGRIALSFACLYPQLVDRLVLESASPGLRTSEERAERRQKDKQLASKIEEDGVKTFIDYWETLPLFATQKQLPKERRAAIREERLSQTEDGLALSLRSMGTGTQPSWWEDLNELRLPTLLLAGSEDPKFVEINKNMDKRLPQSDLRVVQNAGHAIHVEQPIIFGNIVNEFILARFK